MISRLIAATLLVLIAVASGAEQHHRDPLNAREVDQLRDAAQDPETRLKLYVEFARARLAKLEQVRADQKLADRTEQTRAALQDFVDVYDELSLNVDTYADRGADLRKALRPVIEGDTEFGAKLRAFKASLASSREEVENYEFLVASALEAVDEGAKEHRDLLAEQQEAFKNKKTKDRREDSSSRGE
jgi:hypothetical protein